MKSLKRTEVDFEEFGFQTRLECVDRDQAREICMCRLQEYERDLKPDVTEATAHADELKNRDRALHVRLYDRPIPVNDATMLVRSIAVRTVAALAVAAAIASLAGNVVLFQLFGFGAVLSLILAVAATSVPLAVGHLAYEKIIARYRILQAALIVAAALLCYLGIVQLGQSRTTVLNRALASQTSTPTASYVDQDSSEITPYDPESQPPKESEAQARQMLGDAMFKMLLAAEILLGLLAGLFSAMRNDEDYAAWRKLRKIRKELRTIEKQISELIASIEIARLRCAAGILRAENILNKRHPPYYKALAILVICILLVFGPAALSAQTVDHYEGILIDTSGSIARSGATNELLREYLVATQRLLVTEPPSSRVWVSAISTDSFGGVREILKGWTPEAHGVFTDDLTRARRELGSSFEKKSAGMSPVAAGTDIIGGLWHMKALIESDPNSNKATREIWIFSDMMNETPDFNMPTLLSFGPEHMLERAKANDLMVPLRGYKVHIEGASPKGLSPEVWVTTKRFWTLYLAAAGAELTSYSVECSSVR